MENESLDQEQSSAPVSTESAQLPPVTTTQEERYWSIGAHLATLISGWIPLAGIIGPLIVWLVKKQESAFIERQSREALNFQISVAIYLIISTILMIVLIGWVTFGIVAVLNIVFSIIAAIKVSEGKPYQYPFTIRLIKNPEGTPPPMN